MNIAIYGISIGNHRPWPPHRLATSQIKNDSTTRGGGAWIWVLCQVDRDCGERGYLCTNQVIPGLVRHDSNPNVLRRPAIHGKSVIGDQLLKPARRDVTIGLLSRDQVEPMLPCRADPGLEKARVFA